MVDYNSGFTGAQIDDAVDKTAVTNIKVIEQLSDFPTPSASVITLETGVIYRVNGIVDIGANRIAVNGANGLSGVYPTHDGIVSSTAGALLTAGAGEDVRVRGLSFAANSGSFLSVSGDGTNVVFISECTASGFTSLGTVGGVVAFASISSQYLSNTDGFLFTGTNNNLMNITNGFISGNSGTMFDLGTSEWLSIEFKNNPVNTTPGGATLLSGAVSNGNVAAGGGAIVSGNIFSGAGTYVAGINHLDTLWTFSGNSGNSGTEDSHSDASGYVADGAEAETTISVASTPVITAGTWTPVEQDRFTFSTGGRATYIGEEDISLFATSAFLATPASGTNKEYNAYLAVNGVMDEVSRQKFRIDSGSPANKVLQTEVALSKNDYVEVYIEGLGHTTNVTLESMNLIVG